MRINVKIGYIFRKKRDERSIELNFHILIKKFSEENFSDPFTKLNLSPSLDRANLNAYNPWEIVSRLQTIERIFNLIVTVQVVFLSAKLTVLVPSIRRNSLAGIVV